MTPSTSLKEISDCNNNAESNQREINRLINRHPGPSQDGPKLIEGGHESPPTGKPPFTLKELRDAIPLHCFERPLLKSLSYVLNDFILISILLYLSTLIHYLPFPVQLLIWPIYLVIQTGTLAGLFVLAHDCCHNAFSKYPIVNDAVGIILDAIVLVPYLGFKFAHHKHHRFTASYELDNAHAPAKMKFLYETQKEQEEAEEKEKKESFFLWELLEGNFSYELLCLSFHFFYFSCHYFLVLWFKSDELIGKKVTLFSPTSVHPFRSMRDLITAALSDIMFLTSVAIVLYLMKNYGIGTVYLSWVIPIIFFWTTFGFVTFLQHTDTYIPWYKDPEWTWMRGALSTVDRSLGPVFDLLTHNVAQHHAVHHLFPQIPFYHAKEATEAVKPILGKYYMRDDTNFVVSLHRAFINCKFVDGASAIAFKKNFMGS